MITGSTGGSKKPSPTMTTGGAITNCQTHTVMYRAPIYKKIGNLVSTALFDILNPFANGTHKV